MNRFMIIILAVSLAAFTSACSSTSPHHGSRLPDPAGFDAHFGDMDTDGDGFVTKAEFNAHFDNPDENVFKAVDLDENWRIDHDEWHAFKEAHGMKHHE